jgi:hypothetical protein
LDGDYVIDRMTYQNRGRNEANEQVVLTFSDGTTQTVALAQETTTVQITNQNPVSWVRIDVAKVYGTINNGAVDISFYSNQGKFNSGAKSDFSSGVKIDFFFLLRQRGGC